MATSKQSNDEEEVIEALLDPDNDRLRLGFTKENCAETADEQNRPEEVGVFEGQDISKLVRDASKGLVPTGDTHQSKAYMSADEAAEMLGVSGSTIARRIQKNELLGFKTFKGTLRIPKDQFVDEGVIHGVSEVIKLFEGDHKPAWSFLNDRLFYGSDTPRPIDRLRLINTKQDLEDCLVELAEVKEGSDRGDYF